jgi:hypothetical protein
MIFRTCLSEETHQWHVFGSLHLIMAAQIQPTPAMSETELCSSVYEKTGNWPFLPLLGIDIFENLKI